MTEDMVIFTRTYDLLAWLLPEAAKFPKSQRFAVTKRLHDAALDLLHAEAAEIKRSNRDAHHHPKTPVGVAKVRVAPAT